ncbi:hypothetical protein Pla163_35450 [Planctomycetes bacterium Pla163]|uniref:DUF1800 domain-containing protein n=1 Tax=Rohdeia mirabilis TaxID=2528008 RepID=A0A518D4L2_9BACT|nr:hypothetical protein Pla163_35450 [Planctomycetes bacterium Pla163]
MQIVQPFVLTAAVAAYSAFASVASGATFDVSGVARASATVLATGSASVAPAVVDRITARDFDAAAAEHLLNRAGFGGTTLEAERLARLGPEAAVALLLEPVRLVDPFFLGEDTSYRDLRRASDARLEEMGASEKEIQDARRRVRADFRKNDRRQLATYANWWVARMVSGDDPVRDRMTLFWTGLFTSSFQEVKNSRLIIEQHQLLRDGALGSYADLLRGIARDPAMLEYLDAASNKKQSPNENFARELLELFSLGEGHYAEADIVAAARAFTGWTDRNGEFQFNRRQHDRGEKTFMGVTGDLDGDDVLEIVLAQDRCAEYIAGRLLEYFEGRAPSEARVRHYGRVLRSAGYEIRPVLEELFVDRAFYSDAVVGQRIASPLDFMIGHARRIGVDPPTGLVAAGASSLGETLFHPPSVKGWDPGRAWITTTTFMQRGNLAGVLVGTVGSQEFLTAPELGDGELVEESQGADAMEGEMMGDAMMEPTAAARRRAQSARKDDLVRLLDRMEDLGWQPLLNLSARAARLGATNDAEVVDLLAREVLAVELSAETRAELLAFVAEERAVASLTEDVWTSGVADAEHLARRLVHLMLSLPEGQLH